MLASYHPSASALQVRAAHHERRLQAARLGAAWMAPLGNLACVGAVVLGQVTLGLHEPSPPSPSPLSLTLTLTLTLTSPSPLTLTLTRTRTRTLTL